MRKMFGKVGNRRSMVTGLILAVCVISGILSAGQMIAQASTVTSTKTRVTTEYLTITTSYTQWKTRTSTTTVTSPTTLMTTETVQVLPPNPTVTEVVDQRSTSTIILPTTVTVEKEAGLISGLKPEIIAVIALIAVVAIGAVVVLRRRGKPSPSERIEYREERKPPSTLPEEI
jgi:carbohydrate-binding DOMON domain-containing protein